MADITARYRLVFRDIASSGMMRVAGVAGRMSRSLKSAASDAMRSGAKVAAFNAALAGGAFMLAGKVAARGDEFAKFSKQVDISADKLQRLEYVANRQGASFGKVKAGMKTFTKRMGELRAETGALASGLKKLDPEFAEQLKATKSNEQAYDLMIKKVASLSSAQERAAFASAAFSKEAGAAVVRIARDGVKNVEDLLKTAGKIRPPMSKADLKRSEAYSDSLYNAKSALSSLSDAAGSGLLSPLTSVLDKFTQFIVANRELIKSSAAKYFEDLKNWVADIDFNEVAASAGLFANDVRTAFNVIKGGIEHVDGLSNALKILGAAFAIKSIIGFAPLLSGVVSVVTVAPVALGALTTAVTVFGGAFKTLSAFMLTNPIGIAITLITTAGYLLISNWDEIKAGGISLWNSLSATWDGIKNSTSTFIDGVMEKLGIFWGELKTGFTEAFGAVKSTVTTIWNSINEIVAKGINVVINGMNQLIKTKNGFNSLTGLGEQTHYIDKIKTESNNAASNGGEKRDLNLKVEVSGKVNGASTQTNVSASSYKSAGGSTAPKFILPRT